MVPGGQPDDRRAAGTDWPAAPEAVTRPGLQPDRAGNESRGWQFVSPQTGFNGKGVRV